MVLESARDPNSTGYVEDFEGDGYIALAIIFAFSVVCDCFAPTVIAFLGLKLALLCGSGTFAVYTASFYYLDDAMLYSASALLGVGNAVLWVAQVRKQLKTLYVYLNDTMISCSPTGCSFVPKFR